ncbi:MalY/PatB family protein [Schleiferilactobacillus shenzhenensis]|uniref:cysteine-S-conjugate beta-lyase n=1 Tax=Schleiferilactobacillus shenzhenensis LY-73 TaxID=1231336 RepID=U4TIW1_9LACO|nr:MalY/PatB family protein [Schleiferilactobacillus shenzhenensis]ERL64756.1 aminotransferase [Schleiferilactobacillus shenzhenensis LY-73]
MTYDFTTVPPRRGTNSIKWDVPDTALPMWIADMDFPAAPEIIAAMQAKVSAGIFGYEEIPPAFFTAAAQWNHRQHHLDYPTDWMLFAIGVMPAINAIIRRLTNPGDRIVIQPPVYNMFFSAITDNGRRIAANDLVYDRAAGTFAIDFADLERKLADPVTTMMLLCNPQNPVGKIWTRDELLQIASLCRRYHVTLVSDEIHRDLVLGDRDYTSLAALPESMIQHAMTLFSPTKTFNMAGLHSAVVTVPNPVLRASVTTALHVGWVAEPNLLAVPGTIAAYTAGGPWLSALKGQLRQNITTAVAYLAEHAPQIKVIVPEASYLLWLDCGAVTTDSQRLTAFLTKHAGVVPAAGTDYGAAGKQFLRLNIACPPALLNEGLDRLAMGLAAFRD